MIQTGLDLCNHLHELARSHNGQNVWVRFSDVPIFLIQRFEDADYVLRLNHKNYLKNMVWFRQAIGRSRFSEDGQEWEVRRDLTQPFFVRFDRQATFALACKYARKVLPELVRASQAGQTTMDDDTLRRMAISVLIENFFGITLEQANVDITNLGHLMEYSADMALVPPGQSSQASKELQHKLTELRQQTLKDLAPFRQGKIPSSPLLDALLQADRDGKVVLEHELLTLFSAGAETTAATVGWLCYLLARYPQKQEELYQICAPYTDTADWQSISKLELIGAWISEALRLFPSSPILDRLAVQDDVIGGEPVKAGQNIMISLIGVQHDERLHPSAWELHLGDDKRPAQNRKNSGVNTAFSLGPRVCGGKNFALVELAGFLHTLVTHARFTLTSETPPRFAWKALMLREGGQPVHVAMREGVSL